MLDPKRLAARGGSPPSHRGRRCARLARRDDREYREYLREEQRRQAGCSAGRMQADFHHGLLAVVFAVATLPALLAQGPSSGLLIIEGGTLVDGRGGAPV